VLGGIGDVIEKVFIFVISYGYFFGLFPLIMGIIGAIYFN
tara:strand:+ start:2113 stop:2232 length:120 start_codon:yes stop_codon:yes gene_type:complete